MQAAQTVTNSKKSLEVCAILGQFVPRFELMKKFVPVCATSLCHFVPLSMPRQ